MTQLNSKYRRVLRIYKNLLYIILICPFIYNITFNKSNDVSLTVAYLSICNEEFIIDIEKR